MSSTKASHETKDLTIYCGAGNVHEVPNVPVEDSANSTLEALRQIARQEIRDPELLSMLNDDRVVIQNLCDETGSVHERPISPEEKFSRVLESVETQSVELGVSVSHEGGSPL